MSYQGAHGTPSVDIQFLEGIDENTLKNIILRVLRAFVVKSSNY